MSKVMLALGSFVMGAFCMYLLGSHTSTIVQSALAQTENKMGTGMSVEGAEPVVPPIRMPLMKGLTIGDKVHVQPLDGIRCEDCTINADEVTYAGGSIDCVNCKIKGDRVTLKGAALNTFLVLQNVTTFLNVPDAPNPNAPHVSIAANKRASNLRLVSATK